jgi:hypothetical protein
MDKPEWLEQFASNESEQAYDTIQHVCCFCDPKHLMDDKGYPMLDAQGARIPTDPNHMARRIAYSHGVCHDALKEHYPAVWHKLYDKP